MERQLIHKNGGPGVLLSDFDFQFSELHKDRQYTTDHKEQIINWYLEEISNIENTVVGTGGGVIISSENREIIKNLGFVVYLTANIKELVYRTAQDKSRPLIKDTNAEKIMIDIIKEREGYYENTSNIKISTDNYDTVKISKIIIKNYEKNNS